MRPYQSMMKKILIFACLGINKFINKVKPWFTVPRFTLSPDLPGLISFPLNLSSEISQDHWIMCQSS
jgi:hypothetical protein